MSPVAGPTPGTVHVCLIMLPFFNDEERVDVRRRVHRRGPAAAIRQERRVQLLKHGSKAGAVRP